MADSDCLEREEEVLVELVKEEVLVEPVKSNPQNEHQPASTPTITPAPNEDRPQERRTCTVSCRVQDIIYSRGTSSSRPTDPTIPQGIQLPPVPPIAKTSHFEGEESPAAILLLENDLLDMDEELAMVLETAKAEALEPTSFVDMQQCTVDQQSWSGSKILE